MNLIFRPINIDLHANWELMTYELKHALSVFINVHVTKGSNEICASYLQKKSVNYNVLFVCFLSVMVLVV